MQGVSIMDAARLQSSVSDSASSRSEGACDPLLWVYSTEFLLEVTKSSKLRVNRNIHTQLRTFVASSVLPSPYCVLRHRVGELQRSVRSDIKEKVRRSSSFSVHVVLILSTNYAIRFLIDKDTSMGQYC